MGLIDLDPQWIMKDGKRIGFLFRNPVRAKWWVSCFFVELTTDEQEALIEVLVGERAVYQSCNPAAAWTVAGPIESATFETLSVQPSLDGGPNLWHGHITNGQIVGGI